MCGRFTLTKRDFEELAHLLDAEFEPAHRPLYRPRYNIAPTDPHWIVRTKRERRELLPATWGLVNGWAADANDAARRINARSETAPRAASFREAYERRRCIVPADGFFEWSGTKAARRPIWFHAPDDGLLLFAGLYESWRDPAAEGASRRTFTILTTAANDVVAPVHDRMPVILDAGVVEEWLFVPADESRRQDYAREASRLLGPARDGALVATQVSPRVNSVRNDDPACLEPAAAATSLLDWGTTAR